VKIAVDAEAFEKDELAVALTLNHCEPYFGHLAKNSLVEGVRRTPDARMLKHFTDGCRSPISSATKRQQVQCLRGVSVKLSSAE
jgi:hypothetical protein